MSQKKKEISFTLSLIPLVVMIVAMGFTIIQFEGSPHIPLILGTMVAGVIAWLKGFTAVEIEESIYKGIRHALPAIVIIILVGLIIGAWIGGGVVPSLIYYGLQLISPSWFLVSISVLCAIVAISIGSSWSTMATMGVAGMGVGISLGIPEGMIAGAIISGSYFGDKMSPLSDTTNLASGIAGADLFEHIKHMLHTTIPAFIITLIVYAWMGSSFSTDSIESEQVAAVLKGLEQHFVISPWLLLIPLTVIVLVIFRVPALPALCVGVMLGFLSHVFIQPGTIGEAVVVLHDGYAFESHIVMLNELLNRGGIESMMYTVSLTIVAMTFGGVLEETGMLRAIVMKIISFAKTSRSLVVTTIGSAFFTNLTASEQYMSVILPARMYTEAYDKMNLHPKNLSRAVEDGGTLTSVFIPWNTCGVFIIATLGVHPFVYAPYAILNIIVPILSIIFAITGYTIAKKQNVQPVSPDPSESSQSA
ncbi:Na+/H+ antiporter NhaC [Pontibacillus litoralis]|uniref:Sodium:proton antiporter n=1 Tax=Pontibacillus litoralis JSM 072002 TaxID=1385512 RepID=A0A0A5HNC5_9BACI|nr:Na+/H+ antiporter NhaC [Pontibacillus litoralis]KGX85137.1 sodium:proton antiporter [Pontibacillus litoralis JSM 072002]